MGNKKKPKAKAGKKKTMTGEQSLAVDYVREWALRQPRLHPTTAAADFLPSAVTKGHDPILFEFHCHTKHSDGFLSPSAVVERAHRNGVKVLALTDHDTMAGVREAVEAAGKYGMRIIPGVEISAIYSSRGDPGTSEPVHILAYYGTCGPSNYEDMDKLLSNIRDGRYTRARNMLLKLNKLKVPIKWEHVAKIAGDGVAPGRVHVARAMVEAGHVENLREAFNRYLYDGGPAYAMGSEPCAEAVVRLINHTGGISALAHPWSLKNPVAVIRGLKTAGLHALEVYRSDGKAAGFDELANTYELLKLGGSDYHGRGGQHESDLGSVNLPVVALYKFLKVAHRVWYDAMKDMLLSFIEKQSDIKVENFTRFGNPGKIKISSSGAHCKEIIDLCLSLVDGEGDDELDEIRLKLADIEVTGSAF